MSHDGQAIEFAEDCGLPTQLCWGILVSHGCQAIELAEDCRASQAPFATVQHLHSVYDFSSFPFPL